MKERFYIGLAIAIATGFLIFIVSPWLRVRYRDEQRNKLESWYQKGPRLGVDIFRSEISKCKFCGGTNLQNIFIGRYVHKKYFKKINREEIDGAHFYELRCAKCGTIICKEKKDLLRRRGDSVNNVGLSDFERAKTSFLSGVDLMEGGMYSEAENAFLNALELVPNRSSTLSNLAAAQLKQQKYDQAYEAAGRSVAVDPTNCDGWFNYGLASHGKGDVEEASRHFEKGLELDPNNAEIRLHLSRAQVQLKLHDRAIRSFNEIITNNSSNVQVHKEKANIFWDKSDFSGEIDEYRLAVSTDPGDAESLIRLGAAFQEAGRYLEAIDCYSRVIKVRPNAAEPYSNRGLAYHHLGSFEVALQDYQKALALAPDFAEAHLNLGMTLKELGRLGEGLRAIDRAIAIQPDFALAHSNKGLTLHALKRPTEAMASYRDALAIDPNLADAHTNLGVELHDLNKLAEALASHDKALQINPGYADAYNNRGVVLSELGQSDDALQSFDKAIALKPEHADAHHNKALLQLSLGSFAIGWEQYEWRWKCKDFPSPVRDFKHPPWSGDKTEKRLLIWAEQGVGDQVLYGGLLPELMENPQDKLVVLDKRLLPLFKRSMPELEFLGIEQIKEEEGFDEQIPIGSLPRLLRPTKESFKKVKSPYLVADAARVQELRQLVQRPGKRICGVSWSSKREEIGQGKSISLAQMLEPLASDTLHFVNLQYGDTAEERAALLRERGIEVQSVDQVDNFNDIDGLAALIEACDVVVTTSNTTVHLAGALGKDTLLLLPRGRSRLWYWGHDQTRSIWYPPVRIYAQEKIGDWQHPLTEIKHYLTTINGP